MKKQINDTIKDPQKATLAAKESMDGFYSAHMHNITDFTTIVIKNHLYIEQCLNDFFLKFCLIRM